LYNNHCYKKQRTVISTKFTSTCFSDPRAYNSTHARMRVMRIRKC